MTADQEYAANRSLAGLRRALSDFVNEGAEDSFTHGSEDRAKEVYGLLDQINRARRDDLERRFVGAAAGDREAAHWEPNQ